MTAVDGSGRSMRLGSTALRRRCADSSRSPDDDRSAQVDPKAAVNPVAKSVFWRAECTNRIWLGSEYHDRSRDRLKSISSPGEMPATFPSLIAPVSRFNRPYQAAALREAASATMAKDDP